MAKLILPRARQLFSGVEVFQLIIDGEPLASIKNGCTAVIELPVGHHEVAVWVGWCQFVGFSPCCEL